MDRRRKTLILLATTTTVALGLFYACNTQPPRIPDKVEVRVYQRAQKDSQQLADQLREMDYYMRTHDVTDEGYNLIAQYHTLLTRMARTAGDSGQPTKTVTRRIAAKDRLAEEKAALTGMYNEANALKKEREKEYTTLVSEEKKAQSIVNTLAKDKKKYKAELDRKRKEVDKLNKEIQRILSKEVAKKDKAIDYTVSGKFEQNKGKLPWPYKKEIIKVTADLFCRIHCCVDFEIVPVKVIILWKG